jgi:endonuclease YncB( thermonuclease family)
MTMMTTAADNLESGVPRPADAEAAGQGAPRGSVRDLIQAAIDRQKPLPDTRRAAALIAETSVRPLDDAGGFVIIGADGAPRTAMRDGTAVPFTLDDLAADIRDKHSSLFEPGTLNGAVSGLGAPAAPARDWLRLGSDPGDVDPAVETTPPQGGDQTASTRRDLAARDWLAHLPSWNVGPMRERWTRAASVAAQRSGDAVAHLAAGSVRLRDRLRGYELGPTKIRGRHWAYAGAGVAVLVLMAMLVPGPRREAPPERAPAQAARSEPAAGTGSAAAPQPAAEAKRAGSLAGVPEIVDTATLRLDGNIVRLFGVEWARGAPPEDLTRYIGGRAVVCTVAARPDRHRCQVDGYDLSEAVLYNGGGRATADATPEMKEAEAHARAERLGVWQKP